MRRGRGDLSQVPPLLDLIYLKEVFVHLSSLHGPTNSDLATPSKLSCSDVAMSSKRKVSDVAAVFGWNCAPQLRRKGGL